MISVEEILNIIDYQIVEGDKGRLIGEVLPLQALEHSTQSITWVSEKNLQQLDGVRNGAVVCPVSAPALYDTVTYIKVQNPRLVFSKIHKLLFPVEQRQMIASSAVLAKHVTIGKDVCIEHHVVIEEGCEIGEHTVIGANTVIRAGAKIGDHVMIGCNCSIGGLGFGYELNEQGVYERIKHTGNVVIGDYVEIGSNTCIDRAVLGSTHIADHCKIDNLVHIAHGVRIGRNSVIIANSMIAGSTVIGANVWVAPSASVLNKLTIADDAILGMGAVIIRNVEEGDVVAGNPGKVLKKTKPGKE